ncbi:methyl-accepting chemotaxis protein [Nodularia sphaerocarpa]|uniref:methyl-accepting chemotaxis protein n=1 Tax=Nodularia sphaerocarpa TaxID=137816 RepID=UPI001EFC00F5|nr:methyl-accepting chemotaxis protein [Nodularia sphaerocarpa]MDB9373288.1 methyl-accepting chemotaxis protein [Nodularia sphaerocarpa CS-585]MDB9380337.1 methyl-accepting chemotaxis protein [Nodularia sphaerocarpa CS-585A2]ULP70701.1 Methyl-accepting chemotaxis protein McpP [Nodularia sphaerocarpa UHCC 0038]
MFNQTDKAKSKDSQNQSSLISSPKNTDGQIELSGKYNTKIGNNSYWNYVVQYIQRLSLSKKAAVLAIAITTLPIFAIGAIAYSLAHKSMTKQINQSHAATATKLTEQINRFMLGRYEDIQIISQSPFFTNTRVNRNTTTSQKQSFLDSFVNTHKAYSSIAIFDSAKNLIVQSTNSTVDNAKIPQNFAEIIKKDAAVISQPEKSVINMAAPIKNAVTGNNIAVVSASMPIKSLAEVTQNYTANGSQYYLLDSSGKVFLTSQTELLGAESPGLANLISAQKGKNFTTIYTINKKPELISYIPSTKLDRLPDLNWQLLLTTDRAIAFAPQRQLLQTIAISTILLALIVAAIALWIVKVSTQPILDGAAALSKLAQGELHTRWETAKPEELEIISANFNLIAVQLQVLNQQQQLRNSQEQGSDQTLQKQLLELLSQVEGAARGDLTVRAEVTDGEIGTVADFFNSIVESLRDIVTQVQRAATQVNGAIGANEAAISQLAKDAITQAAEINRTLDAVDQMTDCMEIVSENAQKAASIANKAAQTATKSGQAMDLTVQNILGLRETVDDTAKKVKRLGESSQQISHVVSLINQIATQTNLLAINAGIEAARAGEEGQGFAVVAEEVGELARSSASATEEIEQIVENIQRETSEVVQAMDIGTSQVLVGTQIVEEAKQSLSQILDVSQQIDFLVQSISTATVSQLQTSQAVSQLMQDIAAISQRTSDSSHVVSKSLHQTLEISQQLQETVETFKVS